ncbi:hypothetical protein [Agromyces laixinhei]|uniref:hypothetical protein n=1 Tax=Agromyces laixinhei TaxID=2585717 RepID=UPI001F2E13C9|nr:hypothetical protein [Agromyces laixinhei]
MLRIDDDELRRLVEPALPHEGNWAASVELVQPVVEAEPAGEGGADAGRGVGGR